MSSRRADLWSAIFLIALVIVLFSDVLFLGNNFYLRDLFQYHFPLEKIVRDIVSRGEFPWWERRIAGGQPVAANPAYEVFYPGQWPIFIGPFPFGFALHIVAHIVIALLGMYAFLRALALRVEAALFGALSFGLSGFLLGSATNLPTFFVWSWAGVIGWALLRALRTGKVGAAAIATAMPLLVGDPMAVPQLLLLALVGTLFFVRRAGAPAATLKRAGVALLLAIGIACVQLVPAVDDAGDTTRARGFRYDVVTDFSMPPVRPLEIFDPHLFGILTPSAHAYWGVHSFRRGPYLPSLYVGFAVVALAIAGLLTRQRGWLVVLALAVLSYILAIGGGTPLFRWLYDAGIRSIRYPEKFAAMGLVTAIVFAAFVCDRLLAGDAAIRRVAVAVSLAAALLLAVAGALCTPQRFISIWRLPSRAAPIAALDRRTLFAAAIMAALWAVALWRVHTSRLSALAALALLLFDLGSFGNEALPRMPREFFTPPPLAAAVRGPLFHIGEWTQAALASEYATLSPGWTARNALRPFSAASWGIRSILESDFDETELLPTHDLLEAMIRAGDAQTPGWTETFATMSGVGTIAEYRPFAEGLAASHGSITNLQPIVLRYLPRHGTYFFPRILLPLEAIRKPQPLDAAYVPFAPFPPAAARVTGVRETSSRATIDVEAAGRAFLVATVTRQKYWKATIDGHPAPLLPANFAYQGLVVPAGKHRIEMRYWNSLLIWGAAISIVALIIALIPRRLRPRTGS